MPDEERCPPVARPLSDRYERGYSRSAAETRLRRLIKAAGLPPPAFNAGVAGFEVDAVWRRQKLIAEVDGYQAHGHHRAFERDRAKDHALIAAGYVVVRFTWNQLTKDPFVVVALLAGELAKRS